MISLLLLKNLGTKNYKEIVEFSVNYILTSDKYSFIIEDCFEQLFKNKEKL